MKIGYGKFGRSMPLTLAGCGTVGGDTENVAVLKEIALRRPQDEFWLLGRNTGESLDEAGLPPNIVNPWPEWQIAQREFVNSHGMNHAHLTVDEHQALADYYRGAIAPTFCEMDALIIWVGQHGSSNHPLPMLDSEESAAKGNRRTKPHDWEAYYCSYFMVSINAWRDMDPINHEEIYLNADARNVQKMRDLHWPWRHPTLAQYDLKKDLKFDRGTDPAFWVRNPPWNRVAREISNPNVWQADVYCVYSRLEINSLSPIAPFGQMAVYNDQWDGRKSFGIFINEARPSVKDPELVRGPIVKRWVMPLKPNFIHGKWSDSGQKLLGREVYPLPWDEYFPALHAVRSTLTTPSSGSGWATTKPWEAFAAGTVCFFHPNYDTQGHILKDAPEELRKYLRVLYPDQLERRVKEMNEDRDKWGHMVKLQREHFDKAITRLDYAQMIMDRLDRKAKPVVGEVDSDVEARAQNA